MPKIRQQGQVDGDFFSTAEREVSESFEEPVLVKRWTSSAGGTPEDGVADTDIFTNIRAKAVIEQLEAHEIFFPGSIYVSGDLRAVFRIQVFGAEAETGDFQAQGRRPDRVVYRNRTYFFVGHVDRKKFNERVAWIGVLRQEGP